MVPRLLFCFILTSLSFQKFSNGANVLYLSNLPSPSHFIWCKALLTSLHERGHNITALSPDVEESKENFTYHHLEKVYSSVYNGSTEINFFEMGQESFVKLMMGMIDLLEDSCKGALSSKGYQELLEYPAGFKFDLIIYDFTMSMSQCLLGIVEKFKGTPMVAVSPFMFNGKVAQLSGSLIFSGIVTSPYDIQGTTLRMNVLERILSTFNLVFEVVFERFILIPMINKRVHDRHPGIPHIDEIEKKATRMILLNTQPVTDYKVPALPNIKLVGGVQISKPKALPMELKEFADVATNGLVLFSLGTNVRSDQLGEERIMKILRALGRLPKYTFFWKFETKEKLPIEAPKNIIIRPWMPQNDVLAHPNTKLFISHCGLLSSQEALYHGVPVLGFPIFADQPQNALRLKDLGVGEFLSVHDFTENELYEFIKKMLEDPNYITKGKVISSALKDQPMTPIEEATYWAEWVIRNPDINLSSPSTDMNIFVRHSLDVIALAFIVIIIACLLWLKVIKFIIKMFSVGKKVHFDKKKN